MVNSKDSNSADEQQAIADAVLQQAARSERDERMVRVGDLVNPFCDDSESSEVVAGVVRSAFVAHAMFFNECGQQAVSVQLLARSGISARRDVVRMLAEVYSRAVFESAFAMYFDGQDPRSDAHLLATIEQFYSPSVAVAVFAYVAERGVVLQPGPTASGQRVSPRGLVLPAQSEVPAAPAAASDPTQPQAALPPPSR